MTRRLAAALPLLAALVGFAAGYGLGRVTEAVFGYVAGHGVRRVEAALEEIRCRP